MAFSLLAIPVKHLSMFKDCFLAAMAPEGKFSKDDRVSRGGFGLVAIDSFTLEVKRMWYGSVPGAQSGYTAECTALLHALLRTSVTV